MLLNDARSILQKTVMVRLDKRAIQAKLVEITATDLRHIESWNWTHSTISVSGRNIWGMFKSDTRQGNFNSTGIFM